MPNFLYMIRGWQHSQDVSHSFLIMFAYVPSTKVWQAKPKSVQEETWQGHRCQTSWFTGLISVTIDHRDLCGERAINTWCLGLENSFWKHTVTINNKNIRSCKPHHLADPFISEVPKYSIFPFIEDILIDETSPVRQWHPCQQEIRVYSNQFHEHI